MSSRMNGSNSSPNQSDCDDVDISDWLKRLETLDEIKEIKEVSKGDYFDLLDFPDEIIDEIFSYLPIEDRMRVRMNMRLAKIVADSKYYMGSVRLHQDWRSSSGDLRCSRCSFGLSQPYSLDFIRRIAHNISIGELQIEFPRLDPQLEIAHKFCNIFKEFRSIRELHLISGEKANEVITDSFFLDLSRRSEFLDLYCRLTEENQISTNILHSVYKGMKDGSVSARHVHFVGMNRENRDAFLNFLGVIYRNERVISNRNIQVYRKAVEYACIITIYDGLIRTSWEFAVGLDENYYDRSRYIDIKLHENEEALIKEKMLLCDEGSIVERLDIYPE